MSCPALQFESRSQNYKHNQAHQGYGKGTSATHLSLHKGESRSFGASYLQLPDDKDKSVVSSNNK